MKKRSPFEQYRANGRTTSNMLWRQALHGTEVATVREVGERPSSILDAVMLKFFLSYGCDGGRSVEYNLGMLNPGLTFTA